jgi:uncharacterized RDD family membrane protein YckC
MNAMSQPPDPDWPQPEWGPAVGGPPTPPGWYGLPAPVPGGGGDLYRDPISGLMLPRGTKLAGIGRRTGAWFLGFALFFVTLGVGYVIWGLLVWAGGQTPALQVLGMRCYRPEDARVPGWWWMALREVAGQVVEGLVFPFTALVSFALFAARRDRRSLHDLMAGTVVLHDPGRVLAG